MANTSAIENELRQLINKARKAFEQDMDTCIDWIDDEIRKSQKIFDSIEKIQRQMQNIDSKLFNESRTCCEELKEYQQRLKEHRNILMGNEQRIVVQTLDELGKINDGFQRSRKILFTK